MAQTLRRRAAGRRAGRAPGGPARQRPARGGQDPAGARHRRPRVPPERRPAGHATPQGRPPGCPDRPAQGGRHTPRGPQEDVRPLAARGLRPAGRAARGRRGPGVAGDGQVDQVRGGRRGGR